VSNIEKGSFIVLLFIIVLFLEFIYKNYNLYQIKGK